MIKSEGPAIITKDLTKVFKSGLFQKTEFKAVDSVNLTVERGEFFGLLGPNGAGKTTLIKIISTLTIPTSGTALVNGYDIIKQERDVRNSIGLVGVGERIFYWRLTGMQNLLFFSSLYNIPLKEAERRAEELLKMVGLYQFADTRYMNYSTGMQRKLAIVRALLTDAPILLLDEPSIGLDPISARQVREFLKDQVQRKMGKTVVLTTHYMEEAEQLCDRVGFMSRGKLVAVGSPSELKDKMKQENAVVIRLENGGPWVVDKLGLQKAWWSSESGDPTGKGTLRVVVESDKEVPELIKSLIDSGIKIVEVKMEEPSLYDVFVKLAGSQVQVEGPVRRPVFGRRRE
ncbi:ABC transporter ATP-binding protein [Tardisphaera miroshnichenkoae]